MSGTPFQQPDSAGAGVDGSRQPLKAEPAAQRRPASSVPSISGLVLSPSGGKATLVDISASGLLAECGVALKVGHAVKVTFEGTFTPQLVEARVVRSSVASMTSSGFRYHVGIAFKTPIALEDETPPAPPAAAAAPGSPTVGAVDHAPPASRAAAAPPTVATVAPPTVAGVAPPTVAAVEPPRPPRAVNRW